MEGLKALGKPIRNEDIGHMALHDMTSNIVSVGYLCRELLTQISCVISHYGYHPAALATVIRLTELATVISLLLLLNWLAVGRHGGIRYCGNGLPVRRSSVSFVSVSGISS